MTPLENKRFAGQLAALGHEARLGILQLLLAHHPEGAVVTEVQRHLGLPSSTLAHHLDTLRGERLIEPLRQGRFVRYTVRPEGMSALVEFLRRSCLPTGQKPKVDRRRRRGPWGD